MSDVERKPPESSEKDRAAGQRHGGSRSRQALWMCMVLTALVGIGVGLISLARSDAPERPRRRVDLHEPNSIDRTSSPDPRAPLRVAIAPVISPEQSLRMYQTFAEYLARRMDRQPIVLQRQSYVETNELLRNRRCDVAFVCTYAYLRAEKEFGLQAIAVPRIRGQITYHSFILVPSTSAAASLIDLRGRRFGSADLLSNSGWLYPAVWLLEKNENVDRFFGEHVITGSHDRSVEAVAHRRIDGAAVDSLVYEEMVARDPSLAEKVRNIQTSPPFGMPPLVVHPQIDPTLRESLVAVLLKIHEDPEGAQILTSLGIERFVAPERELYEGVRENVTKWEARKP